MISFQSIKDVLKKTIAWERELSDLLDVAQLGVKNEESKELIRLLAERQKENLGVVSKIDPQRYGNVEWVRYASAYRDEELIPKKVIRRDTPPKEILEHIRTYEKRLAQFYSWIAEALVTDSQKELFQSLATFKGRQAAETEDLLAQTIP